MYIFAVFIFLLINSVVSQKSNETSVPSLKVYFKSVVSNMFNSLMDLTSNLGSYFFLPLSKLEIRKNTLQNELGNVIIKSSTSRPRLKLKIKMKNKTPKTLNPTIATKTTRTHSNSTITTTSTATTSSTATTITKETTNTATNIIIATTLKKIRRSFKQDPFTLAPDMIKENGYKVEVHSVHTKDGYNLVLHRIPSHPRFKANKVALLHHGLLGSSDDWLLLGTNKALPYLMADAGYDVWLTNARGNRYSKTHLRMPVEESANEYWNFSWHEIGQFDLSATMDYIIDVTDGYAKIDFVGYSMGATALLVLLSTLPQYNRKLRCAVLLAPLSYMYTATGPIRYLAELIDEQGSDALNFLGRNEFMKRESYPLTMLKKFCVGPDIMCSNPFLLLANGGQIVSNKKLMEQILNHVPGGGSTKTIVHYCQLLKSGGFHMFDFGVSGNVKRYGMRSPPLYRLTDVTVPLAVFTAADDWLSTSSDVQNLFPRLPFALLHHVIKQKEFSHTDFVFSENATKLVYCHVLYVMDTMILDRSPQKNKVLGIYSDVC